VFAPATGTNVVCSLLKEEYRTISRVVMKAEP